jgi:RsmE family RNA methyltransferase
VTKVLRAKVGDTLAVGRVGGELGTGIVEALSAEALELSLTLDQEPPPPLPVSVILALPRPKVLRRLLRDLACVGVKRIVLLNSWRVEKSYWQSPFLDAGAIEEQLLLGLEQGRDTMLPEILLRPRFKPFVEDELAGFSAGTRALLAHPAAEASCPHAAGGPVTLAIGPEGGFIPYEVDTLRSAGFEAVSLGPRPLRVEAALPFLLGRVSR